MSVLGTLVSDFKTAATDVKDFILKVAGDAPKVVQTVANDTAALAPVVEAFLPGATGAITLADNLLNLVAQAVEDAGTAAGANGLSVTFDAAVVSAVKAVIAAAQAAAKTI